LARDGLEARRFLIILETLVVLLMGLLGAVIFFDRLTPVYLLSTNFILGIVWSLASPAWLSTTPLLVAPRDVVGANAANSSATTSVAPWGQRSRGSRSRNWAPAHLTGCSRPPICRRSQL